MSEPAETITIPAKEFPPTHGKEAGVPVHAPYLPSPPAEFSHQDKPVVMGQRAQQGSSDVMLGWGSGSI